MSGPELITLGCRLNIAESEAIRDELAGAHDLIVVNSCAVTAEAVARTRKAIRSARRRRPDARIVVTGCASTIDPAGFAAMEEVAAVVANTAKLDRRLYGETSKPTSRATEASHARCFLPVQTGCDHSCTFCIIPAGRGASRSLPAGAVVQAAREAIDAGQREVVLTGVDITAYGLDLPGRPTLAMLVQRLLRLVPGLERLRLSSLDPHEMDDALIDLIVHEPKIMPHVHLSLQAGDDLVLKRMKRRHSRAQAVALVARLQAVRPEIAIGADLIAGFPTETEAMFANTLGLLADCDIVMPHIFPYSPRAGTPAARMPQVPPPVIRERAAKLREAGAMRHRAWLDAHVGRTVSLLAELDGLSGHAPDFAPVLLREATRPGGIVAARIVSVEGSKLIGVPA